MTALQKLLGLATGLIKSGGKAHWGTGCWDVFPILWRSPRQIHKIPALCVDYQPKDCCFPDSSRGKSPLCSPPAHPVQWDHTRDGYSWSLLLSDLCASCHACSLSWPRQSQCLPLELRHKICVQGDVLSGLWWTWPVVAHCWSLTWHQIHTVEEESTSLPGCEVDAAGRREKVTSIHRCRTPCSPGASYPADPWHILLHPWVWTAPTLQGKTPARAAGGHQTFAPLWHLPAQGAESGHPSCFALVMALAEYLGPFCSAFAFYMHLSYFSVTDHCTIWLVYTWLEYKRASPQDVGKTFCETDWLKIKHKLTLSFWESVSSSGHRKAEQGVALHN